MLDLRQEVLNRANLHAPFLRLCRLRCEWNGAVLTSRSDDGWKAVQGKRKTKAALQLDCGDQVLSPRNDSFLGESQSLATWNLTDIGIYPSHNVTGTLSSGLNWLETTKAPGPLHTQENISSDSNVFGKQNGVQTTSSAICPTCQGCAKTPPASPRPLFPPTITIT